MKRVVFMLILVLFAAAVPAQSLNDVASGLQSFTNAIAPTIPLNSTTGTVWSDAYIGQLIGLPPHFGIGITAGATCIPSDFLNDMFTKLNVDKSQVPGLDMLMSLGVPLPAAVISGRIGGFILPFDIGVKFGTVPQEVANQIKGINLTYLLAGADLRYAILDEKKNFVDLAVGLGVNYLSASVVVPLNIGAVTYPFSYVNPSTGITESHTISLTNPNLSLGWSCVSADLTAQVSKKILFLTPYAGVGLTVGRPSVTTGLTSELKYDGATMTAEQQTELASLRQKLIDAGLPAPIDPASLATGYVFQSDITRGTDFRVYGGFSLDILFVSLDINALYSFVGKNFGADVGLRFQL